jgi:hypothetical protein
MTDNTMVTKTGQTMIYKTLHRKTANDLDPTENGVNSDASEG